MTEPRDRKGTRVLNLLREIDQLALDMAAQATESAPPTVDMMPMVARILLETLGAKVSWLIAEDLPLLFELDINQLREWPPDRAPMLFTVESALRALRRSLIGSQLRGIAALSWAKPDPK